MPGKLVIPSEYFMHCQSPFCSDLGHIYYSPNPTQFRNEGSVIVCDDCAIKEGFCPSCGLHIPSVGESIDAAKRHNDLCRYCWNSNYPNNALDNDGYNVIPF